jgi:hypothetical protein
MKYTIPAWAFVAIEDEKARIGVIAEASTFETRAEARWWRHVSCSDRQKQSMKKRGYKLRQIEITFKVESKNGKQ